MFKYFLFCFLASSQELWALKYSYLIIEYKYLYIFLRIAIQVSVALKHYGKFVINCVIMLSGFCWLFIYIYNYFLSIQPQLQDGLKCRTKAQLVQ